MAGAEILHPHSVGCISASRHGSFDWTVPDDELFAFVTDLCGPSAHTSTAGACTTRGPLRDRPALAAQSELMADFANVWQAADKVGHSTTFDAASTANTWLEYAFDPALVSDLKASAPSDLTVGGPYVGARSITVISVLSQVPASTQTVPPSGGLPPA